MDDFKGYEYQQFIRMLAGVSILYEKNLDQQFSAVQGGKRDIAMIRSVSKKLLEKVAHNMPLEMLKRLERERKNVRYRVGVYAPFGDKSEREFGMWLTNDMLETVTTAAHEQCATCMKTDKEIRACKLRKCFNQMDVKPPKMCSGACPYMVM